MQGGMTVQVTLGQLFHYANSIILCDIIVK